MRLNCGTLRNCGMVEQVEDAKIIRLILWNVSVKMIHLSKKRARSKRKRHRARLVSSWISSLNPNWSLLILLALADDSTRVTYIQSCFTAYPSFCELNPWYIFLAIVVEERSMRFWLRYKELVGEEVPTC